jgi:hypothetical protein
MRAIVNWFMLVAVPCLAAVPAVGQDKKPEAIAPELIFNVTFDNLSANAVKASGDPRSSLPRNLGLTAREGFKAIGLVLGDGETCSYAVQGNLDMTSASISFWVKPVNWKDEPIRFRRFFLVGGNEGDQYATLGIDSPNNRSARVVLSYGKPRTPQSRQIQLNAPCDFASGRWQKVDVTWDARHLAIYANGRLGDRRDLDGVVFPKLWRQRFSLVPIVHFGNGQYFHGKDRTCIDEVEIWRGVLSADRIRQRYLAETGGTLPPPVVTVPRVAGAINVDGKLDDKAWTSASRVPIPLDAATSYPHTRWASAMICYDERHLYVGLSSPKEDEKLAATVRDHDGPVHQDDAFELFLIPDPKAADRFFQFVVNSAGVVLDLRFNEKRWDSGIPFKASQDKDSWAVEAALPFEKLGVEPPRPGSQWLANFCRDWCRPAPLRPAYTAWAFLQQGFLSGTERCGRLNFVDASQGIRFDMSPQVSVGRLDLTLDGPQGLAAAVTVQADGAIPLDKKGALDQGRFRLQQQIQNVKEGTLAVGVAEDGKTALSYAMRIMVTEPIDLGWIPDPAAKRLGVAASFANIDPVWLQPIREGKARLEISFLGPEGRKDDPQFYRDQGSAAFDVQSLADAFTIPFGYVPGDYQITFKITAPGRAGAFEAVKRLPIPDLPWVDTQVGLTDQVLSPWTPVTYPAADRACCWNRTYAFDGPLLSKAVNGNKDLLRGPIRMAIKIDPQMPAIPLRATSARQDRQAPHRGEWSGPAVFDRAGINAQWATWMEYDGLCLASITLTPEAAHRQVQSLSLEIPLRADVVKYLRGFSNSGQLHTGRRPWDGKLYQSNRFEPFVWVCNEEEGFLYFCESEANWVYPHGKPVVEVHGGPEARIELKLIASPTALPGPITYRFGFQATPVKPLDRSLRNWRFGWGGEPPSKHQNARNWFTHYTEQDGNFKVLRPEVLKKFDQKARARGIRVLYYGATSCVADHNPTTELYRKLWANNFSASYASFGMNDINTPYRDAWPVPYRLMAACPGNRSFNEFMIYYADKALRETGISGLYTDTDGIVACDNSADGHGFTDAFGKKVATYTFMGKREFSKRMAAIHRLAGGERRYWMTHAHAQLFPPSHCWADFWLPGEEYASILQTEKWLYMDTLDDAAWRVEYGDRASGLTHCFLPEFKSDPGGRLTGDLAGPQPGESLLAMAAVTDANLTGGFMRPDLMGDWWDLLVRMKVVESQFIGYWESGCPVKAQTAKALASVYKNADFVAVPVTNRQVDAILVTVNIDLKALGLDGKKLKLTDERTRRPVELKDGTFTVPLSGRNFTFVSLRTQ